MCGIAGLWSPEPLAGLDEHLRASIATLRHRGPDGARVWSDGRIGLAHARLAVIDLSPAADQPMSDESGAIHIVHNGEIYNFQALRHELITLGHGFASQGDAEVILAGYKQWGDHVIDRLRGMFAFALWDSRRRRLLLARDRLGQKPLHYAWHDGRLLFGSEIKAILAWPGMTRDADLEAIHHYLSFRCVPAPHTAFAGVRHLPPAHFMVIEGDGSCRVERYWSLPEPGTGRRRPRAELAEEITALFDESVRLRLVSDVPLGVFLSGGIDSACVVAAMARCAPGTVKTFTIGFSDRGFDERAGARHVAERYATDHQEFVVEPDALHILPKLVWHYGEPFADASAVASWYVSEITRRHVTVALNGDGGDEAYLGYPRYAGCRLGMWSDRLPRPARRLVAAVSRALPFENSKARILRYARRFLVDAATPAARRYGNWVTLFSEHDKQSLYGDAMADCLGQPSEDLLAPWLGDGAVDADRAAYADIHGYLPDDLLVKTDVATMAHGLEARSPFLDHELMAHAAAIPASQRMSGLRTKSLLKSAMAPRLPKEILGRPKRGFGVPIEHWLRHELKDLAYDTLTSARATARGLFRPRAVVRLLDEHMAGRRPHHDKIWALLMLELWFVMWIDGVESPRAP